MKAILRTLLDPMLDGLARRITPRIPPPEPGLVPWGDSLWFASPNLWEPTVAIALRDLVRPGQTVYDVGANLGGLTSLAARLVGPCGTVCSFEASPRIIGKLQSNVIAQGHRNVTVYHNAIYARSNELIPIFHGGHLNDSIYSTHSVSDAPAHYVPSLALDDFASWSGIVPALVKMDIEGAEFDALQGATELLTAHRPHMILEQTPTDERCLDLLRASGYRAIDLATYSVVESYRDLERRGGILNILFFHREREKELPYALPLRIETLRSFGSGEFEKSGAGTSCKIGQLEAGRYLLDVDMSALGHQNSMMCGVCVDRTQIFRYHGYSKLLADAYRSWVFDLDRPTSVNLFFDFVSGHDDTFEIRGARLARVEGIRVPVTSRLVAP